mgnify:FL=1|jgi:crotonobetainyl-CoA:carnitine CoA-transferase CaiB-like acyl-CoA transferase|tara:strand:+ start:1052 stop:2272 length:1221 start_codon:yes stop_codon:yes gene_type:complete
MGALSHIRVLDLSRVLAGPWCTQMLADLGAEVIKIERPGQGDDTRSWGPPFVKDSAGTDTKEAAYFLGANRGKRSVTINIANPRGQEIICDLARYCDVLVENFKVGTLARYGLDYGSLQRLNPGLVYCSITGFGQGGPYADKAGYDFMIQGLGGLMSITGAPDGVPGAGPQKVGVAIADIVTGLYAASAIQAALLGRERSGEGQYIDMALFDCQVAVLANQAMNYLASGDAPVRLGNAHPNIVPYQVFATRDGHLILAVGNDLQFERFCVLAGCPELASDKRFSRNADRVRHRDNLVPELERVMARRATDEWLTLLEGVGIPCGRINQINETLNDPQVRHRGMRVKAAHPSLGELEMLGSPLKLTGTPPNCDRAPPLLGEHTNEVLVQALNYSDNHIAQLRSEGVI